MKLGMQAKFIIFAVPCIALFSGIISLITIHREEEFALSSTTQQGLSIARTSAVLFTNARIYEELGMIDTSGMSDYLEFFVADIMRIDPRIIHFMVLDKGGRVIAHNNLREYGKLYKDNETQMLLGATEAQVTHHAVPGEEPYLDIAVPLAIGSKHWGLCRIGFSLSQMYQSIDELRTEVLGIGAVLLLVSLVGVWYAGRHFVQPIHILTRTMNNITAQGDLATPVPALPRRDDEIGALQASFLWMIRRLREVERQRLRDMEGMHQTEKLATIGQLASGVAHEINNPLGGVILCFRNLIEGSNGGGMDAPTRRQLEDVINQSLEKIRRTVSELLRFARPAPLAVGEASVDELFDRCLALTDYTLSRRGIRLTRSVMPDMPRVCIDTDKMGQVLLNLLLNAADSMQSGGQLLLDARIETGALVITVCDSGSGVPEECRERIFDPFFTTKAPGKGTGLGLAVSRNIVAQHGGTLTLETDATHHFSADGTALHGAAFVIRIPLSRELS